MGFLNYLLLGALAYAAGWAVRIYVLENGPRPEQAYSLQHPKVIQILALFLLVMLIISTLLGRFVLGHEGFDWAFIIVNSVSATFVFSFGLSPDHIRHDLPD
ncbi:hypothetical protein [Psychrobacter sp. FDAARGOS_221]|uniref:hypothetical protein n=1 Tax=Psychrobacter sp. FDAARGOS_221 TaxID=1975705 RepID=UPI000BB539CC|nr:hypothetical protein [Psychrobacter sp. FDAARGOS_221]PNK61647.1 hypothetical protein A6J60_012750 [Psychrobacter sp. FDAARGOS_221]